MSKKRNLPTGWKWEKFGDIAEERLIGLVRGSKEQHPNKPYPYIKMDSIQVDGSLNLALAAKVDATEAEVKRYSLRKGDFLFNTRNSHELVGKTAVFRLTDEDWLYNNNIMRVRFNESIDSDYINLAFHTHLIQKQLEAAKSKTTSVCAIYDYQLVNVRVPLPPLEEQRRIAEILDRADAIRRKRQEAIRLTEELLRSAFLEMFGDPVTNPKNWSTVELGSQVSELRYGTSVKCHDKKKDGDLPILRIPNIIGEQISWDDLKYTQLTSNEVAKLLLIPGDLLFVRTNGNPEYIGRCAVFEEGFDKALYASYLIRARLKSNAQLYPSFIRDIISFPTYRSLLVREARTTAGNYNIGTEGLGRLRLIQPPLKEQENYMRFEQKLNERLEVLKHQIEETNNFFNSLLQRAFRGEL